MSTPNVTLIGEADDDQGRTITIHQDHQAIRIDALGSELMLSIGALQRVMHLLADAATEARLWELARADDELAEVPEVPGE